MSNGAHFDSDPLAVVAAGLLGGFLVGRARKDNAVPSVLGLALVAYALRPSVEVVVQRAGARRGAVTLRTTIEVARPVRDTFDFFRDFENLPRIIGSLRRVVDYQDGRSHWEAYGPSDTVVEWDAVTTKYVPQSVIAWANTPNSPVESRGLLRFFGTSDGRTRVAIEFVYAPRDTPLKDAVSALVTPPRQSQVSADLARAHFYLESLPRNTTPVDG
jgi:uncharacterized membrane protein